MYERIATEKAVLYSKSYPVVTIMGPRQSGKTTLAKFAFPNHHYLTLENPDVRSFAEDDPKSFLSQAKFLILDEIQRAPKLLSYIQGIVDEKEIKGQFILTGSHQFELSNTISQSLAGRTAILKLLPLTIKELPKKISTDELIYKGFYPRIHKDRLNPTETYAFYLNTYVEKDVRDIKEIKNLKQFESFLRLCASHIGQTINKSKLGNDIGIDSKTVDSWLSVLEASFIIYTLQPHYKNFRKRIVKSPKIYFYDTGLAAYLLGLDSPKAVKTYHSRGALFENLFIIEKIKEMYNQGQRANLYFFRDNNGNEVDLLEEKQTKIISYEIKSSKTIHSHFFKGLKYYKKLNEDNNESYLIYSGDEEYTREGHTVQSFP